MRDGKKGKKKKKKKDIPSGAHVGTVLLSYTSR